MCQCHVMYAGNGTACDVDSDGDGFPDKTINCIGLNCVADNCLSMPNTDQVATNLLQAPHTVIYIGYPLILSLLSDIYQLIPTM